MTRYVAFLRAINVAGHARAKMADVRDAFQVAGARNVATVIQSGNVLFDALSRDVPGVVRNARKALEKRLGEEPIVLIRPLQQLARLLEARPFQSIASSASVKLYVVFLARKPRLNVVFPLVSETESLEAIGIDENDVFVVSYPKANGFYGFPNRFVESELGVAATSRNWSTIVKLVNRGRS